MNRLCVIGDPIAHSLSPIIHADFAQQLGIEIEYTKEHVTAKQLDAFLQAFFGQGGIGLNVTVPHKQAVWDWCGTLTERAQAAGAVNTLYRDRDQLVGDNTDGAGLVDDLLRLGVNLTDARVLMLGAGGAARGALLPLVQAGAQVSIHNRTQARAERLIEDLQAGRLCQPQDEAFDVVISASSAGLSEAAPSLPAAWFSRETFAYDMIYGSRPTPFIQAAQTMGVEHHADGLGMLVAQAARAFQRWFGELPDTAPVYQALRRR
ncbi:MAG: shikimate dehydrogenase [Litorivicinus sp.]